MIPTMPFSDGLFGFSTSIFEVNTGSIADTKSLISFISLTEKHEKLVTLSYLPLRST